jgi:hypothetical protein
MAFDTVDLRRSALNLATFGITSLLFIPLTPDGSFSTDDSENALGFWIGLDVSTAVPGEGEKVYASCPVVRSISAVCTVTPDISKSCPITRSISKTCEITREIHATTKVDD